MITYDITNLYAETPETLLIWAYFSNDRTESFRFPIKTGYDKIMERLQARCDEMVRQEEERQKVVETLSEVLIEE